MPDHEDKLLAAERGADRVCSMFGGMDQYRAELRGIIHQAIYEAICGVPPAPLPPPPAPHAETKWTDGDWHYEPTPGYQFIAFPEKSPGGSVPMALVCTGIYGRDEEVRANLRLAATAPRLYRALVWALDQIREHNNEYHHATPPKEIEAAEAVLTRARDCALRPAEPPPAWWMRHR